MSKMSKGEWWYNSEKRRWWHHIILVLTSIPSIIIWAFGLLFLIFIVFTVTVTIKDCGKLFRIDYVTQTSGDLTLNVRIRTRYGGSERLVVENPTAIILTGARINLVGELDTFLWETSSGSGGHKSFKGELYRLSFEIESFAPHGSKSFDLTQNSEMVRGTDIEWHSVKWRVLRVHIITDQGFWFGDLDRPE